MAHFRAARVVLPKFSELADPATIPDGISAALADVGPDEADPGNLFRVTWYNGADPARARRGARPSGAARGADRR